MITEIGKKNSANFLVLGVNLSNNGSICLMRGGEIELYIESERITRKKWDHCIKDTLYLIEESPDIIALTDSFWMRGDKRVGREVWPKVSIQSNGAILMLFSASLDRLSLLRRLDWMILSQI